MCSDNLHRPTQHTHGSALTILLDGDTDGIRLLTRRAGGRPNSYGLSAFLLAHHQGRKKLIFQVFKRVDIPKPKGFVGGHGVDDLLLHRKSTRLNSSNVAISYAVFCLKKKI